MYFVQGGCGGTSPKASGAALSAPPDTEIYFEVFVCGLIFSLCLHGAPRRDHRLPSPAPFSLPQQSANPLHPTTPRLSPPPPIPSPPSRPRRVRTCAHQVDLARRGQVEPDVARLEREQEHAHAALLPEPPQRACPLVERHRAVQPARANHKTAKRKRGRMRTSETSHLTGGRVKQLKRQVPEKTKERQYGDVS
eukprot:6193292-Pleurochrysis_carterae.AAC.4